jgi:serine/threonine protein kinase
MSCLHSIGISHNNSQPENVIFDKENGIKVVGLEMNFIYWDSEMERVITKKKISVKDKKQLSQVNHMPPEAFQSDTFDPSIADVWSLGLLLFQMIANNYWNVYSFLTPIIASKSMNYLKTKTSTSRMGLRIHAIL